jgi:hypothetical protein
MGGVVFRTRGLFSRPVGTPQVAVVENARGDVVAPEGLLQAQPQCRFSPRRQPHEGDVEFFVTHADFFSTFPEEAQQKVTCPAPLQAAGTWRIRAKPLQEKIYGLTRAGLLFNLFRLNKRR